jgi:hypothetical protein
MKNTTSSDTLAIVSCWVPLIADHGHHGLSWPKRAVIATKTRRGYKEAWLRCHQRTVSNEVLAIQLGFEGQKKTPAIPSPWGSYKSCILEYWLVVGTMDFFPFSWECHLSN